MTYFIRIENLAPMAPPPTVASGDQGAITLLALLTVAAILWWLGRRP